MDGKWEWRHGAWPAELLCLLCLLCQAAGNAQSTGEGTTELSLQNDTSRVLRSLFSQECSALGMCSNLTHFLRRSSYGKALLAFCPKECPFSYPEGSKPVSCAHMPSSFTNHMILKVYITLSFYPLHLVRVAQIKTSFPCGFYFQTMTILKASRTWGQGAKEGQRDSLSHTFLFIIIMILISSCTMLCSH